MSKRKSEDQVIKRYQAKIKKLEQKQASRRRRIIEFSESDSDLENEEIEAPIIDETVDADISLDNNADTTKNPLNQAVIENLDSIEIDTEILTDTITELDPDICRALGDATEDIPVYGEDIHVDLAKRWHPILREGLVKEVKEKLLKEHVVPSNCKLLKAPTLNAEISVAVPESVRIRDKRIEFKQNQLGLGITAISKAMSLLLADGQKVDIVKLLSEGCRILSDLHSSETKTRSKLITPNLDKSFLNIIQEGNRDDTLFGSKLSEKIRSAKAIEKQGLQIKRAATLASKPTPQQASNGRRSGNWTGPPRYPAANRGGRGGYRYTAAAHRQAQSTYPRRNQAQPPTAAPPASAQHNRQNTYRRAPPRQ